MENSRSHGTNSRLPFAVNTMLNLSNEANRDKLQCYLQTLAATSWLFWNKDPSSVMLLGLRVLESSL